jgi:hypothetical protein
MSSTDTSDQLDAIAVIGMTCRFPGARDADEFWRNLDEMISVGDFEVGVLTLRLPLRLSSSCQMVGMLV